MNHTELIKSTEQFVKQTLINAEGGHDWFHVLRVWNNAKLIAKTEVVNELIVDLSALLHDIADSKFYNGDETVGPKIAREFLEGQGVDPSIIDHVSLIIATISYKHSFSKNPKKFTSPEFEVVQDADRLDAIGAIGIARCFNYGGFKNRPLYNPAIQPKLYQTKSEYQNSDAPTINHFYEKLLHIKDKMNTPTGKKIAEQRHQYMERFLEQFYGEWGGELKMNN